jgi:subtilisin-like proprotein convertase family protein
VGHIQIIEKISTHTQEIHKQSLNRLKILSNSFVVASETVHTKDHLLVDWVEVHIDITHEAPSDLKIAFLSPSGTTIDFVTPSTVKAKKRVRFLF